MVDNKKISKQMVELRKYIPTPQDAVFVKEMLADGLTTEQVLEALGHVGAKPINGGLPEGHQHAHKMTSEQEEREAKAAELGQPGEDGDGDESGDEEGDEESDPMTHLAGLLASMTKGKAKKRKKGGATGGNGG